MASNRNAIRRLMQRNKVRKQKSPGLDPDDISETGTEEKALRLLLKLPDEENFIEELERFMIDCGRRFGDHEIESARLLWRSYH